MRRCTGALLRRPVVPPTSATATRRSSRFTRRITGKFSSGPDRRSVFPTSAGAFILGTPYAPTRAAQPHPFAFDIVRRADARGAARPGAGSRGARLGAAPVVEHRHLHAG